MTDVGKMRGTVRLFWFHSAYVNFFLWLMDLHYKGTTGSSNVFLLVSKWRGLKRDVHVHTPPSLSEMRKDTFNDFPYKIQACLSSTSVLRSHAWVGQMKFQSENVHDLSDKSYMAVLRCGVRFNSVLPFVKSLFVYLSQKLKKITLKWALRSLHVRHR